MSNFNIHIRLALRYPKGITFWEAKMQNKGYFKGWYFKCCTGSKTVAFIPAYHYSKNTKTASLQIISDDAVCNLPFKSIEYTESLCLKAFETVFKNRTKILKKFFRYNL